MARPKIHQITVRTEAYSQGSRVEHGRAGRRQLIQGRELPTFVPIGTIVMIKFANQAYLTTIYTQALALSQV